MRSKQQLNNLAVISVSVVLILQLAVHSSHAPIFLTVTGLLTVIWRLCIMKAKLQPASSAFKLLVIISCTALFLLHYELSFTLDIVVGFLLLSICLKFIELRYRHDCFVLCFALIYLICSAFLFEQSLTTMILQFVSMLCCFVALYGVQRISSTSPRVKFSKSLSKAMLFVIPFAIFLFVFFPRMGPIWTMTLQPGAAKTGLSDSMSPGDIADLSQSGERVFRVSFDGSLPPKAQWYWRGVYLDEFDGSSWNSSESGSFYRDRAVGAIEPIDSATGRYTVTLEPHFRKWGFSLSGAVPLNKDLGLNGLGMVRFENMVTSIKRYEVAQMPRDYRSVSNNIPAYRVPSAIGMPIRDNDLALPDITFERTDAMLKAIQAKHLSDIEMLEFLMILFRKEPFFYSLKPPIMNDRFMDRFLFEERTGFCAHYASAMTYMLRYLNIPARIIMGYQGGELSEDGQYIIVHQYDAHAWVEVYLNNIGWVRVDPTAMVAPERIIEGLEAAVREEGTFLSNSMVSRLFRQSEFLSWARLRLDAINYEWQSKVVGFDQRDQASVLSELFGNKSSLTKQLLLILGVCVAMGALSLLWIYARSQYSGAPYSIRAHHNMIKILSRHMDHIEGNETPRQMMRSLERSKINAKLVDKANQVFKLIEEIEYGNQDRERSESLTRKLKLQVRLFKRQLRFS